jgi:UDP-N-acetylmuramate dehydrogenase
MLLKESVPLAPLTTLGVGGAARWFVEAASEAEIAEASDWARGHSARMFVLGGGSNLLVADAGFDGLVVRVGLRGIASENEGTGTRLYRVAAGEAWERCVARSLEDNCAGLECLAGIPGTVGGTPVQNVGAYGQEVASVIACVRAYDLEARAFVELSAVECGFSYRRSRFNTTDRDRFLVTRVDYRLRPGGAPTLDYADVRRAIEAEHAGKDAPTLAEVAATVRLIRRSKGMLIVEGDPDSRSAGSFFKNPVIGEELFKTIAARNAEAGGAGPPKFSAGAGAENLGKVKIPAAWLIEQAGFHKGVARGAAGISSRHTLALVNRGGAQAGEILALASQIREAVEKKFGIRLEMEPVLLGF